MGGLVRRLVVRSDMPLPWRRICCFVDQLVRSVVASCIGLRKSFTDEQFQIAYLLQECVMVRDGLAKLHECEKYIYYIYYILLLFGHVNSDESCLSNMLCFICHF